MLPIDYRARASTLRRLAEAVADQRERVRFLDVAAEYEKLAAYAQLAWRTDAAHTCLTEQRQHCRHRAAAPLTLAAQNHRGASSPSTRE